MKRMKRLYQRTKFANGATGGGAPGTQRDFSKNCLGKRKADENGKTGDLQAFLLVQNSVCGGETIG